MSKKKDKLLAIAKENSKGVKTAKTAEDIKK